MKIPNDVNIASTNPYIICWDHAAQKLSMEHGVFIEVLLTYRNNNCIDKVEFTIGGKEFGSLRELRKALRNKAFL